MICAKGVKEEICVFKGKYNCHQKCAKYHVQREFSIVSTCSTHHHLRKMTDITDDIAEELSFQGHEDDFRLLQSLLDDVFHTEVDPKFMLKVERTGALAQDIQMTQQEEIKSACDYREVRLHPKNIQ